MISQNVWAPPFFLVLGLNLKIILVISRTLSILIHCLMYPVHLLLLSGMPLMGQEQLTLLVQHLIRSLARALVLIKLNLKVSVGQGRLFMYTLPYNKS